MSKGTRSWGKAEWTEEPEFSVTVLSKGLIHSCSVLGTSLGEEGETQSSALENLGFGLEISAMHLE